MSWQNGVIEAIKDTKKTILKKKIILNIIIENYAWYDRIFRYAHMFIALTTPLISFVDQQVNGDVEKTSTTVVVLSSIVAGMIKLKDYLKFDKLRDQAKQQTVKYQQLYQRIEREMRKVEKQNGEEFISWITRELSIIEIDDPDLPQNMRKKYVQICQENNIPYNEDLEALGELFAAKIQVEIDRMADSKLETASSPLNPLPPPNPEQKEETHPRVSLNPGQKQEQKQEQKEEVKFGSVRKPRSMSDEAERQEYHEKIKTLNTAQDLNWVIERLNGLT